LWWQLAKKSTVSSSSLAKWQYLSWHMLPKINGVFTKPVIYYQHMDNSAEKLDVTPVAFADDVAEMAGCVRTRERATRLTAGSELVNLKQGAVFGLWSVRLSRCGLGSKR
jgi:hypothetical protein